MASSFDYVITCSGKPTAKSWERRGAALGKSPRGKKLRLSAKSHVNEPFLGLHPLAPVKTSNDAAPAKSFIPSLWETLNQKHLTKLFQDSCSSESTKQYIFVLSCYITGQFVIQQCIINTVSNATAHPSKMTLLYIWTSVSVVLHLGIQPTTDQKYSGKRSYLLLMCTI